MPEHKDFYKEIIDNLHDGVYFVDRDRVVTYWNKGAERLTGYPASHTIGRACRDNLLNHVTANGVQLCLTHCPLAAVMEDGNPREAEVFLHHADGHRVPVVIRATALRDENGNIIGAIETFNNNTHMVTARRRIIEMHRIARTDSLTGIGNRQYMEGRIRALMAEFGNTEAMAGLIFMDIDRFKNINDTYGHDVGDKALCMVANTLRNALRSTDAISRWGGEEFIALVYDMFDAETLHTIAEKVRSLIASSRLDFDEHHLTLTVSVGATFVQPDDTCESLVRRADLLMYQSKKAGGNRVTIG